MKYDNKKDHVMKLYVLIALSVFALGCTKDKTGHKQADKDTVQQPASGADVIPFSATLTTNPVDPGFKPNAKQLWNMEDSVCQIRNVSYETDCELQQKKLAPNAGANAGGSGNVTYDAKTRTLTYTYNYKNLSGPPLMMHFHLDQKMGALNPIVQTVCGLPHGTEGSKIGHSAGQPTSGDACPEGTDGQVTGTYKLDGNSMVRMNNMPLSADAEANALMNGQLYLNIHTCLHPLGELNGPLTKL